MLLAPARSPPPFRRSLLAVRSTPEIPMRLLTSLIVVLIARYLSPAATAAPASAGLTVREAAQKGGFPLVGDGRAAVIVHDNEDHTVVGIAASCLAADIERVSGVEPRVQHTANPAGAGEKVVIVGSLDRSRHIR